MIDHHADRDNNGSYELWDRFRRVIQTSWRPTTGTGANHVDLINYGRDYVGNITYRNVRVDQIAGATTDVNDFDYTYDPLDRLIDSDMGVADNATGQVTTPVGPQETWTLDQLGNWSAYSGVFGSHTRSHNTVNEITAYSGITATPAYDAAGNMTTMNKPETTSTTYTARYDAWNRLVDINTGTVASYQYDGLNRRIKRVEGSTTTFFYYTEQWQCIEERTTETGPAKKQFVWGPNYIDELVLRDRDLDGSSGNGLEERLYALHDQQYNIITVLTPAAVIRERNTYLPYGNVQPATANFTNLSGTASAYDWQHRHTGVRRDVATQLQLHRNRYYHFQMGRWISRDPVGYEGNTWNLYEFLGAHPLIATDPDGKRWDCITCACCAGAAGITCAALCATDHWDVPGESFWSCYWKCLKATPGASGIVDAACGTACVLCAGRGRISVCPPRLRRQLQDGVNRACKRTRKCTTSLSCPVLKAYEQFNRMCASARDAINYGCYLGGNRGHRQAANDARRAAEKCARIRARKRCP